MFQGLGVFIGIFFLFGPIALADKWVSGKVGSTGGKIYATPSLDASPLGSFNPGARITVADTPKNGFYGIYLKQAYHGHHTIWMPVENVELLQTDEPHTPAHPEGHEPVADTAASSAASSTESGGDKMSYLSFNLSGMYLKNSSGNNTSAYVSWTPSYQFGSVQIGGSFGLIPLRGLDDKIFYAFEYGFTGTYKGLGPVSVQVLGGMQYWTKQTPSVNKPAIGLSFIYPLEKQIIDSVQVGYTYVATSGMATSQVRAGVNFAF